MKQLTEAQAWREIARRIAENEWGAWGLCWEASALYWNDAKISHTTYLKMRARILRHLDSAWAYPHGEAEPRILAALWFEQEALEEAKAALAAAA